MGCGSENILKMKVGYLLEGLCVWFEEDKFVTTRRSIVNKLRVKRCWVGEMFETTMKKSNMDNDYKGVCRTSSLQASQFA